MISLAHDARKQSPLSDLQPHQRDTGDEATRLRYARNLLARSASLLRIKPYLFYFWQGLQLFDVCLCWLYSLHT